ncbi:hypothetical protein CPB86DRAFT_778348 [Serendipita vermifera]|nr:hypothetical protein CPB86DRAFT_778348 [Serendipita vermifera]
MGRARGAVRVPGVKLRPADVQTKKKNVVESDNEDDAEVMMPPGVSKAIFKGVVLSATGIKTKRELFELVRRMGGTHSNDFTDATTHLIADGPGSQKYKCAVERDIPILKSSWVYAAHEKWLAADNFSLEALMEEHRHLPFIGMRFCVTGINTADVRERIHKLAKRNGGEYLKALDKTCTHLLCAVDNSDKISFSKKWNADRENARSRGEEVPASIQLLWEEWFWDSILKKGVLDYEPYLIINPRPDPMTRSIINTPDVTMKKDLPPQKGKALPTTLPLADLLTDNLDGAAPVKRKKDAAAQEWEAIVKMKNSNSSGHQSQVDKASREQGQDESGPTSSPMKKSWGMNQPNPVGAGQGWARRQPSKRSNGTGELSKGRATISAVPLPDEVDRQRTSNPAVSFLGKISRNNAFGEDKSEGNKGEPIKNTKVPNLDSRQIFTGSTFLLLGDASCNSVSSALQQAGGVIIMEGAPDYYIVRFVGGAEHSLQYPKTERRKFRTECWVERCLFEGRQCSVAENITYTPMVIRSPPPGISGYSLALSGLDSSERTWVSRLCRFLDIQISQNFSAKCTHLLCPTGEGIKCKKAKEWNIPIVGFEWLTQIASSATEDIMSIRGDIVESSVRVERSMEALKIDGAGNESTPLVSANDSPTKHLVGSSLQLISSENLSRNPSPTRSPQRRTLPETVYNQPISPSKEGIKTPHGSLTPRNTATILGQGPGSRSSRSMNSPIKLNTGTMGALQLEVKLAQNPVRSPTQRVVSSATPSPLAEIKDIPGETSDENSARLPFQLAFAKTLTKNIGAVIGAKRPAEDQGDIPFSATTNSSDGPRKRPRRPQAVRAKNQSGSSPNKLGQSTPPVYESTNGDNDDVSMYGGSLEMMDSVDKPSAAHIGIAVSYSDPNEVKEQQRLLMLLNGDEESSLDSTSRGRRTATSTTARRRSARYKANQL